MAIEGIIGEGSSDNPYQIPDVETFIYVSKHDTNPWYAELTGDIDFNDYNNGVINGLTGMPFSIKHLNGKGHTIKNINYIGRQDGSADEYYIFNLYGDNSLENVNFESINIDTDTALFYLSSSTSNCTIKNCNISCRCKWLFYPYNGSSRIENTTISVEKVGNDSSIIFGKEYYGIVSRNAIHFIKCNININSPIESDMVDMIQKNEYDYCRLELDNFKSGSYNTLTLKASCYNVFIINRSDKASVISDLKNDNYSSYNVLDITLWGNHSGGNGCVTYLPTEDMKSAEKLQAAGFPVVAE